MNAGTTSGKILILHQSGERAGIERGNAKRRLVDIASRSNGHAMVVSGPAQRREPPHDRLDGSLRS
jgi:hypothetical protein